jgi:hypothetical protein
MPALSPSEVLQIWERGTDDGVLERALLILAAAEPGARLQDLAALSIGERDRRLFAMRAQTFGGTIAARTVCPHCGERVEFTLPCLARDARHDDPALTTEIDGVTIRFRLITSADLQALGPEVGAEDTTLVLTRRCIEDARVGGVPIETVAPELVAKLDERLSAADPDAEVLLDLTCPACAVGWTALFDIATFFWSEIAAEARRLTHHVHRLASCYGWSEADVLAMSGRRRQAYLEYAQ